MHAMILTGDDGTAVAISMFNHSSQAVYTEDNTLTITLCTSGVAYSRSVV